MSFFCLVFNYSVNKGFPLSSLTILLVNSCMLSTKDKIKATIGPMRMQPPNTVRKS